MSDSDLSLVFAPDHNLIRSLEIAIFLRFIGVDWSPIFEDHFHHYVY